MAEDIVLPERFLVGELEERARNAGWSGTLLPISWEAPGRKNRLYFRLRGRATPGPPPKRAEYAALQLCRVWA